MEHNRKKKEKRRAYSKVQQSRVNRRPNEYRNKISLPIDLLIKKTRDHEQIFKRITITE